MAETVRILHSQTLQKILTVADADGDFVVLDKGPIAFNVCDLGFVDNKRTMHAQK